MSFTDLFGGDTVPPSQYAYQSSNFSANAIFVWPEQYDGTDFILAALNDLTATIGSLSITLPDAMAVSVGRDFVLNNIGAQTITVLDNDGNTIATIDAGIAKYFYLADNSTTAGVWRVTTYGAGSNTLDAGTLAGYGLKASGASLQTNNLYRTIGSNYTVVAADRARVVNVTSGSVTVTLPQASTVGDGFFVMIRNSAIGTITVDAFGTEEVDGSLNKGLAPNEAAIFICNSAAWFTVGYGRDAEFAFTEYVVNAAAGNVTLSSSDVAGRMIRVSGTASGNFTVTMPTIDNVYFVVVEPGMGAFTVTFKTAIGIGVTLGASQNVALYSDGTNIALAVTTAAVSSIDLDDGLATAPSLRFSLDLTTGIFRPGAGAIGFTSDGTQVGQIDANGYTGSIVFVPTGSIASTTVAGAIAEVDADRQANTALIATNTANIATNAANIALKADIASPTFTGDPKAPTPALGDNDTSLATTAFVVNAFGNGFGGGPFAMKNKIINGEALVTQRTAPAAATTKTYGQCDRWLTQAVGATVFNSVQSTTVPTVAQAGLLFTNSILVNITTADAAIAASDFALLGQNVEGYNWKALAQRACVLSFWVGATVTGTYCVSLINSGADRSYVAEYTINSADTWEFKTIAIPASPSGGTWDYTTGVGVGLRFALAAGTNFHTTAGAWQTGNFLSTSNQVNAVNSNSNQFRVTGIQLESGSVATPFEQRLYGTELQLCRRYCNVYDASTVSKRLGMGQNVSTTLGRANFSFDQEMRSSPTGTFDTAANYQVYSAAGTPTALTAIAALASDERAVTIGYTVASGLVAGDATRLDHNSGAGRKTVFDAEL